MAEQRHRSLLCLSVGDGGKYLSQWALTQLELNRRAT